MNKLQLTCDKCGEDFDTSKIHQDFVSINVSRFYFQCPHCDEKFVSYYQDQETLKLQTLIKESKNRKEKRKWQKKLKRKQKKLKKTYG